MRLRFWKDALWVINRLFLSLITFKNLHAEIRILRLILTLPYDISGPTANFRKQQILANDMYQAGKWRESIDIHKTLQLARKENKHIRNLSGVNVRFLGSTFTQSIGHMAIGLSVRAKALLVNPGNSQPDSIILTNDSANWNYLQLWERYFRIIKLSDGEIEILEKMYWPLFEDIATVDVDGQNYDLYEAHNHFTRLISTSDNQTPLLKLSEKNTIDGRQFIEKIGGDPDKKFITIHIRQSGSEGKTYGRNAIPETYLETIEHLSSLGFNVFRIGGDPRENFLEIPNYFDISKYASPSNIYDNYFLGGCSFMIGTTSGPLNVPQTFGIPTLATNAPDIARFIYLPQSLVLPKKVEIEGRILTLSEMLNVGVGHLDGYLENFGEGRMKWVDNSAQEILNATVEMIQKSYLALTNDQMRIRDQISEYGYDGNVIISQSFINHNRELFEKP